MSETDLAEILRILRKLERIVDLALRVPMVRRFLKVRADGKEEDRARA